MNEERRKTLTLLAGAMALPPFMGARPAAAAPAPAAASITLVRPRLKGGLPLMEALARRQSTREFAPRPLSQRQLSEVLWAGFGINRPNDLRTAPNWRGVRSVDLYAVLKEGCYRHEAAAHRLILYRAGDFQRLTGSQDFVATAPLNLLMVADLSRMPSGTDEAKRIAASADAACIAENVYLYCASEGLGTVMRGNVEREPLHRALGLRPEQYIAYAQTVGVPNRAR